MKSTTTYLHFSGNCRSAMAFYYKIFGGELEITAFPDASGQPNTDPEAPVMHSKLALGGQPVLMASDYPPGVDASGQGNNFSVFIDCSSNNELDTLFAGLARGGAVTVPPSEMPNGRFAMCDDSFGTSWILNCAQAG